MFTKPFTLAVAAAIAVLSSSTVRGAPIPTGVWPTSTGSVQSAKPIVVAAGTVFDGKMQTYDRSDIVCKGGNASTAETVVFLVEPGATLKNVIIGKNQMDGVYCEKSDCTIENVWWDDVCEDALTIKGGSVSSVSRVIGGGARFADDMVIQHEGAGSVSIDGFYGDDVGKLYRSCDTCGAIQRSVSVSNVYVVSPQSALVTVNSNFGDVATLRNISIKSSKADIVVCGKTVGTNGAKPKYVGDDVDGKVCQFSTGDVMVNSVPLAGAAAPTTREAAGSETANEAAVPATVGPTAELGQVKPPAPWPASAGEAATLMLISAMAQPQGAPRASFGFTQPQANPNGATPAADPAPAASDSVENSFGFGNIGTARGRVSTHAFHPLKMTQTHASRRVYATLITSDSYSMGVEALAYSLVKVHAQYPLLVLHTPQVSAACVAKLERFCQPLSSRLPITLRCVPDIGIPQLTEVEKVHVPGWINSGYSKLHIFALEEFEKIVYIDADAIVLQNVDELFDRDTKFAAAPDVFPPDRFNAGVLVIQPSRELFENLLAHANTLKSYDGGDTGFLNMFFPDWFSWDAASRLPFGYNAQRTMYWLVNDKNPGYWNAIQPLKILHFSSNPKPWEDAKRKGDLEMIWWQLYTEARCSGFVFG